MRVFETYQEGKDALIKYIKENKKDKSPLIIAIGSSQQHAGKTTLSKDLIETLYKDGIIIRGTTDYDNPTMYENNGFYDSDVFIIDVGVTNFPQAMCKEFLNGFTKKAVGRKIDLNVCINDIIYKTIGDQNNKEIINVYDFYIFNEKAKSK